VLILAHPVIASPETALKKPWDYRYVDLETGCLWKVIGPVSYRMMPNILTWRSKPILSIELRGGSKVIVRNRFSLLGQWIETGVENRYVGLMAAPSVEWWNREATWSVYGGLGGGFGWIDSQGGAGGQGRDGTLNWFGTLGLTRPISESVEIRFGGLFQHFSNGGATDPNVGLNSLGFTTGISWRL
jgi:lipid A 3-O-deacylase